MSKRFSLPVLLPGLLMLLFLAACDAADPEAQALEDETVDTDVAASVATLVDDESGGMLEQVGDLVSFAAAGDFTGAGKDGVERTYDETTGTWTVTIDRHRTNPAGTHEVRLHRVYTLQFLNAQGDPQQFYITEGDTARTINFNIVEGSGSVVTPRVSGERTDLSGSFVATDVHTDTVTINGAYSRSGIHHVQAGPVSRTLEYDFSVEVFDLVGPRGSRLNLSEKVSGTLVGHYTGTATVEGPHGTRTREIDREVRIEIEDGTMTILINGVPREADTDAT